MPISEVGHARNVQFFQQLISFVTGWGAAYNPSNTDISLAALNLKLADANAGLDTVTTTLASNKVGVNDRENVFSPLRPLTTRVVNFYASTAAAENSISDALGFKRKIDGKRSKSIVLDDPSTPEDESAVNISASQQSFTQLVEHFDNLIGLLSIDANYNPNETELQIADLENLSLQLKAANTTVINGSTALSNARMQRDDTLYTKKTGLVDIAASVKKYAKALFGATSPQYAQISCLAFRRP